jgi:hypothetical protein
MPLFPRSAWECTARTLGVAETGVRSLRVMLQHNGMLRHIRIVPNIALLARILVAPVLRRHAEQHHVQNVRLAGINQIGLACAQFRRHKVFLDRIGMDVFLFLSQLQIRSSVLFGFLYLAMSVKQM